MRLSTRVEERVVQAIANLSRQGVLQPEREALDYELVPGIQKSQVTGADETVYFVGLYAQIPGTGGKDQVGPFRVLDDPYSTQEKVDRLIATLYQDCQQLISKLQLQQAPGLNGGAKMSPGGLALPN
jgi:hypothetical protein